MATDRPDAMVEADPPRLPLLYAKALLRRRTPANGRAALPRLVRTDLAADAGRLRRYTRVCGFAAGDTVPGTYRTSSPSRLPWH